MKRWGLKKALFGMALVAAGCVGSVPAFAAAPYNFTYFTVNGAKTQPFGINNLGQVVGSYYDGVFHGFIRERAGTISTFDVPNSVETIAETINNQGMVVGGYYDAAGVEHGFFYDSVNGGFRTYDAPVPNAAQTFIHYVNDNGDFTGHYIHADDAAQHPFIVKGAMFTEFPGVPDGFGGYYPTDPDTLTNNGDLAGHFFDGTSTYGFVFENSGRQYLIDPFDMELERMNIHLATVGYEHVGDFQTNAFYLNHPDGTPIRLFAPGQWVGTFAEGINDLGAIAGYVDDGTGIWQGYIAAPVPEPSTFLLTGAGIAGLGLLARRRSRNS